MWRSLFRRSDDVIDVHRSRLNILYYSVHSILEYDEITLFKGMGHTVFPLGVNFGFHAAEPFRDNIEFSIREHKLLEAFHCADCHYEYGPHHADETRLTREFIELFDVVIVMHDLDFIERFWPILSGKPVVWRTIGQMIEPFEPRAARLKAKGMHIVRYSPAERHATRYCGETALIRFAKSPHDYGPWQGNSGRVLTFSNLLAQRYPNEARVYAHAVETLPAALGGVGNEAFTQNIGFLPPQTQLECYRDSQAYFYCSGVTIPYTLNFIEAMMTGIPVVAYAPSARSPLYEVPDILAYGTGIVVSDADTARSELARLLGDREEAAALGERGRERAIELFSIEQIAPQWQRLFDRIC